MGSEGLDFDVSKWKISFLSQNFVKFEKVNCERRWYLPFLDLQHDDDVVFELCEVMRLRGFVVSNLSEYSWDGTMVFERCVIK